MRVFLCFIDGLGVGGDDPAVNPILTAELPTLRRLLGGHSLTASAVPYRAPGVRVVRTDPRLGVPGLPQSATGQTAIFTGQNAAQAIGRHLNAYPTPNLRAILQEHSIFKQVKELGKSATFLNAFWPGFFTWVSEGQPLHKDRRYRPSASTVAGLAAGIDVFRTIEQLHSGEAVAFDIDHAVMRERGFDVAPVDPAEAGRRATTVAAQHHFTLFEHFLTDKAGHAQEMVGAVTVLERVDRFLGGVLEALPDDMLFMVTSDHGNIEDLSVKTHTYNDVPTLLVGARADEAADAIRSLTDITPTILSLLAKWAD